MRIHRITLTLLTAALLALASGALAQDQPWKPLAWKGVALQVPTDWNILRQDFENCFIGPDIPVEKKQGLVFGATLDRNPFNPEEFAAQHNATVRELPATTIGGLAARVFEITNPGYSGQGAGHLAWVYAVEQPMPNGKHLGFMCNIIGFDDPRPFVQLFSRILGAARIEPDAFKLKRP